MKKYNYPKYNEHKNAHNQFIELIKKQNFENLNDIFEFSVFLFDWLVSHIYTIDKQYSEYFEKEGLLQEIEEEERKIIKAYTG